MHVPDFWMNLMSVSKITDSSYEELFKKDRAVVVNAGVIKIPREKEIFQANRRGGFWYEEGTGEEEEAIAAGTDSSEIEILNRPNLENFKSWLGYSICCD